MCAAIGVIIIINDDDDDDRRLIPIYESDGTETAGQHRAVL